MSVSPNLIDYASAYREFSWDRARSELDGLPGGGLNIAYEAVDRHVAHGNGGRVALRLLGKGDERREVTYAELADLTNRFANVLAERSVDAGDVVVVLCGRGLDLYVAVLGALKHRCVVSPLFSAFGPEPIKTRVALSGARVLVTSVGIYDRKVAALREDLPSLTEVLVTGSEAPASTSSLDRLLAAASPDYRIGYTDPEERALLHFTSGTTGTPKGAIHVHEAVVAHYATGRLALDLHDGDAFWCTADPGWVTGTSYGVISPLTCGATLVVDEAEMDPIRWYRILADEKVDVWYTAPTAVRMLMRAGTDVPGIERPRPSLRLAASVGEPLDPEAVVWGQEVLGVPFHDNWWQTETGGIMMSNFISVPIRPGSMGRPLPGVEAALVRCDDEGAPVRPTDDGDEVELVQGEGTGMLALRAGWPSMFRGYLDNEQRYRSSFARSGGVSWYLSGDLVRRDVDGYHWFVARADDVIKTSGHLVGPFEVESALKEHPDVVDAGVYGIPDPVAGALVQAVVVLRSGVSETEAVTRSILGHARSKLGAAVAPRTILVVPDLPKTRSGKVMRRVLRARAMGLPEGDTSTLEPAALVTGVTA